MLRDSVPFRVTTTRVTPTDGQAGMTICSGSESDVRLKEVRTGERTFFFVGGFALLVVSPMIVAGLARGVWSSLLLTGVPAAFLVVGRCFRCFTPDDYLGGVIKLCQDRRGVQRELSYVGNRAMLVYDLPLNEVVFDFYDRLKNGTRGHASFDYEYAGHEPSELVKLSVLVNGDPVDALSIIVIDFGSQYTQLIVRRVREVFDLLWKDKAHNIEQEACEILGVSELRDYFRSDVETLSALLGRDLSHWLRD